jgi:4'-phosphopantetheinyl transferase
MNWPAGPSRIPLDTDAVHVWAINLDVPAAELNRFRACLTRPETERAGRFHFERDQRRFTVARGWLRTLLAKYAHTEPAQIEFAYGPKGKPRLGPAFASLRLEFNLAHAENLAVLAITRDKPVGVDVECLRPIPDAAQLVAQFFSPRESHAFEQLSAAEQPAAFFNLWTRKEAWLKAIGEGIAHSLALVEVSFLPAEPARLLAAPGHNCKRWTLRECVPAKQFVAAVALQGTATEFCFWQWASEQPERGK